MMQLKRLITPVCARKKHFNIVIAGEFNSGKSSVINLLLRQEILPAKVQVSALPPARITPAKNAHYDIRSVNAGRRLAKEVLFGGGANETIQSIDIAMPLSDFNGATISEVSVGQDGTLSAQAQAVLDEADLLVWATMGQRAWCLSEISIVETLPKHLLETAILAVTRSDYLRNTEDIEKVRARLTREVRPFFKSILMLDCSRKSVSAVATPEIWQQSGGAALFDLVSEEFSKSPFYRKAPLVAVSNTDNAPEPTETIDRITDAELVAAWAGELAEFSDWIKTSEEPEEREVGKYLHRRVLGFSKALLPIDGSEESTRTQAAAFSQGAEYLHALLAQPRQQNLAILAADMAFQLLRELKLARDVYLVASPNTQILN